MEVALIVSGQGDEFLLPQTLTNQMRDAQHSLFWRGALEGLLDVLAMLDCRSVALPLFCVHCKLFSLNTYVHRSYIAAAWLWERRFKKG